MDHSSTTTCMSGRKFESTLIVLAKPRFQTMHRPACVFYRNEVDIDRKVDVTCTVINSNRPRMEDHIMKHHETWIITDFNVKVTPSFCTWIHCVSESFCDSERSHKIAS